MALLRFMRARREGVLLRLAAGGSSESRTTRRSGTML
jgi:hypothetical protein